MAVTITNLLQTSEVAVNNIIWSADADTDATVAHGLGVTPGINLLLPLGVTFFVGQIFMFSEGAVNVVVRKNAAVGSGAAGAAARLISRRTADRMIPGG